MTGVARRAPTVLTPEQLKSQMRDIRAAGNTSYGGDGERILSEYLRERGHVVEWVHAGGIDFALDGAINVDVKAHLALDKDSIARVPKPASRNRAVGVCYPIVVFLRNSIRIVDMPAEPSAVDLTWEYACELLSRAGRRGKSSSSNPAGTRAAQEACCVDMKTWIQAQWGLRAHVVYRGNPIAQGSMSQRAWGPESFFQDVRKVTGKYDLVVLIYFDGREPRTVFAYPLSRSDQIIWLPKPVGPNRSGRRTFDPNALDAKFVFAGVTQLRAEFLRRFL